MLISNESELPLKAYSEWRNGSDGCYFSLLRSRLSGSSRTRSVALPETAG